MDVTQLSSAADLRDLLKALTCTSRYGADVFNDIFDLIAMRRVVFPERFPVLDKYDKEHTPVTWIISTSIWRSAQCIDRSLRLIRLLHEQLGFSIDECALPQDCKFTGACTSSPQEWSPLALGIFIQALPIVKYLLHRNARFVAPHDMRLLFRAVVVRPCKGLLEVLAGCPIPELLEEARNSRMECQILGRRRKNVSLLHQAVNCMRPRIVELLVEKFGVNIEIRDSEGETALDWVPQVLRRSNEHSAHHQITTQPSADRIRTFLQMWSQRRLAVIMASNSRLGAESPLRDLPLDVLRRYILGDDVIDTADDA